MRPEYWLERWETGGSATGLIGKRRYSPPAFVKASKEIVNGNPEKEFISTSMVERSNLTLRNHTRFSTYDKFYQNVFPGAVNTYSIVARDSVTGEMGVAVQSHWFSVGSLVTWAEAGVGAVATQAIVDEAVEVVTRSLEDFLRRHKVVLPPAIDEPPEAEMAVGPPERVK